MSVLRLVSPPTRPSRLRHEYTELYGPEGAIELDRYPAIEFLPPPARSSSSRTAT